MRNKLLFLTIERLGVIHSTHTDVHEGIAPRQSHSKTALTPEDKRLHCLLQLFEVIHQQSKPESKSAEFDPTAS